MAQTDPLKTLFRSLQGKGALPLEPDDPYYVPIHEAAPVKDPILLLFHRIDMAESESVNLLTGFRGNGKSTELKRLKKLLEEEGDAQVFLVNMLDYVLMTKPLELSDFILSLMAALAGKAEETVEALAPLSQSYWERLSNFLTSEVQLEKLDIGTKGIGMTAKFGFKLKTDPEFKSKIQTHLQGHLTRLVEDAQQFVDELVRKIRELRQDPDKKVVLLVDSLEQIRGVGEDAETIYDSVVELFSGQAANLHFPKLHVVYTVPPYLNSLAHNLGRSLGGHPIVQWPNIHVRKSDNEADPEGLAIMTAVIEKRFPEWKSIIPEDVLQRLASVSGGDLRDFFRLIRECTISLRTLRRSNPDAVLEAPVVNRVIQQLTNELLPIADEDARWLARIHETKKESLNTEKDLPSLARFLDSNLIMNYLNGEPWYDIHPLLVPEIKSRTNT
ncbi:hypothetical protein [uncultured Desulfobacter sp.]|uniref:hypothetical protein n=1 Tax=uncultured Desulfobacter sp. TaxID=240139 RepID=UPI0029C94CB5|nr:hypothetical protein [uncultured Desulfobacter sp.]